MIDKQSDFFLSRESTSKSHNNPAAYLGKIVRKKTNHYATTFHSLTLVTKTTTALWRFFFKIFFSGRKQQKKRGCCLDSSWSRSTRRTECYLVMDRFLCCRQSLKNSSARLHAPSAADVSKLRAALWLYVSHWSKSASFQSGIKFLQAKLP